MASWDTPAVAAPTTASYAAPIVNFDGIKNLLQDYVKGAQMGREEEKANLFRNGIPKDAAGNIDVGTVTDKLARINPDYAMPLINMQIQNQAGQAAANAIAGGQNSPAVPPAPAPEPTAPQISTPVQRVQPGAQAVRGDAPTSIMSMIPDGVSADNTGRIASQVANELKIDPNAPVPDALRARAAARIANLTGVPMTRPASVEQPVAEVQVDAPPQPVQAAPDIPTDALRLRGEATLIRARAAAMSAVNPKGAEVLNKEADAREDRAKQIIDQAAPAPAIKEWRQSGSKLPYDQWVAAAEGDKETAKQDATLYAKKYDAIVENGTKAQAEIPQLEMLQEQMNNDPSFFSGSGEKYNLLYKRLKSAVGIDPDAPVPQELLRKVTASNVLSSLSALKGLGPIRVAEMNMAKEAAASPDNSIPANKMLVEISKRTHQRNAEIADMAQTYKEQNGALDATFDKKVSSFYKDHPLFSDAEIKDWHKVIGDPTPSKAAQATQPVPKQAPDGNFYVPDPNRPGKYLRVVQ